MERPALAGPWWRDVLVVLIVAGCGSGAAPPSAASTGPGSAPPASPPATVGGVPGQPTPDPAAIASGLQNLAVSFLPGGSSAIADACALLTDAEIKDATGHGVAKKAPGPQMGIFDVGCHWQLDDPNASEITLGAISPGGKNYFDTFLAPGAESHIAGLGDDAVRDVGGSVTAVKGDALVSIDWVAFPGNKDMPVTLMRLALAHL